MTCDKHMGEYYSIPCSQCFTAIDPVAPSPNEPIRYTQDKIPFHINWPPRVREHEYEIFLFSRDGDWEVLFCLATATLKKIKDVCVI